MEEVKLNIFELNQVHHELVGYGFLSVVEPYLLNNKTFGFLNENIGWGLKRRASKIFSEITIHTDLIAKTTKDWYEMTDNGPQVKPEYKDQNDELLSDKEKYPVMVEKFSAEKIDEINSDSGRNYPLLFKLFVE